MRIFNSLLAPLQVLVVLLLGLLVILIQSCNSQLSEKDLLNKKNPVGNYGNQFSEKKLFSVEEIISSSESYIGKHIIVNGEISDVCPMRGCWMSIEDSLTGSTIRAKVTDGEIVFPLSAIGHTASVQGIFSKLELTESQARSWKSHLLEEKGVDVHPDSIILDADDYYEYRLFCSAAEIF